jgi:hypothetical protein
MAFRSATIGGWFALAALFSVACSSVACSSTPPPQPPDPIEIAPEPTPPPKPRPKKCETLLDQCEGGDGKKARIPGGELTFQPAEGWFYSQEEAQTVMQTSDAGPAVALLVYETDDPKTEPNREAAVKKLLERLAITQPKEKINWKKPAGTKPGGVAPKSFTVSLWQLEGATRGEKKGPWLIFAAQLTGGKSLLGMGFVPDDDSTSADALILKSLESIEAP